MKVLMIKQNFSIKKRNFNNGSGIYQILNLINNKRYIGSAKDLFTRFKSHRNAILNNKHGNCVLQRAFNKYGLENFEFIILEYTDIDLLIKVEQSYLDDLNPEYNICKNAGSTLGKKCTDVTKKKISEQHKGKMMGDKNPVFGIPRPDLVIRNIAGRGKKLSDEAKDKLRKRDGINKKINQYDKLGNFIRTYFSISEAERQTGVCMADIVKNAKGRRKSAGSFIWKYNDESI